MSSTTPQENHRKALIGTPSNFWIHSSHNGFDLTHPPSHSEASHASKYTIQTTTQPITIDPSRSALVIIDMQNYFLHRAFGREEGSGHAACKNLAEYAIPAARKAGMQIIWLNWGLTEQELKQMPPAVKRAFGFSSLPADAEFGAGDEAFEPRAEPIHVDKFGNVRREVRSMNRAYSRGMGTEYGHVMLEDGQQVNAGRLLMRDSWNAALYPPLDTIYSEGAALKEGKPDVWIHKNRMSGLWGATTDLEEFLEQNNIRTLLFGGVNTDQCVGGTLTDAFSKGYDCILLSDGCGTTSPDHAQQCFEYNAARTYGFCTSCKEFAAGI